MPGGQCRRNTASRERELISDRSQRSESTDSIDAKDPTENSEKAEPTDPIDRNEPTDPIDSTEPRDQSDSTEPCDRKDHRDEESEDMASSSPTSPLGSTRNDRPDRPVVTSMTTWGFIGSGNIGSTVARLAVAAGHDVVMSNSRGPETLADLVAELGPNARAATAAEAAKAGDVVVVTIPLKNYRDVPADELAGKVVIDTMNYYPQRDGQIAELDSQTSTSSELLQAHLPSSHVVKAFNNIFFEHLRDLARPSTAPDRSALAIAGDDIAAKQRVTELLGEIGYDTVDLGPLAEGWRTQPDTPAYGLMYAADVENWTAGAKPADAAVVARRAAEAQR